MLAKFLSSKHRKKSCDTISFVKLFSETTNYSQHSLIRTLKGPNTSFELANFLIIKSCHKSNSRKTQETASKAFFVKFKAEHGPFLRDRERDRLHAFSFILIFFNSVTFRFKVFQNLSVDWPNGAF